jgi:hypothetical protein
MPNDKYSELRREPNEKVYADYDEEFDHWAVFGEKSGFCYAQFYTPEEADSFVLASDLRRI